jgi:O-methyltransferase involved in polyketide biosynthesis
VNGPRPATAQPPRRAKTAVVLDGVPETMLWTLYHRANEARRPDAVLHDPWAVELVDAIDYPFAARFGRGGLGQAQGQALRALQFDTEIRRFLDDHPGGTVVALGEGLETQFWRVDDGRVRWLSVDLPAVVDLRRALLPAAPPRVRTLACSAADERWMDEADPSGGVLVTAQGLLMYLEPAQVHRLVAACAARFPGAAMLFDAPPRWFAAMTRRGVKIPTGYRVPAMPWGADAGEWARLRAIPNVAEVRHDLRLPRGRGLFYRHGWPVLYRLPVIRNQRLWIARVRFAEPDPGT